MQISLPTACTSASSIKTRIKTFFSFFRLLPQKVRVHLPLKQGLRQIFKAYNGFINCTSASSIKTRIKTSPNFTAFFKHACTSASSIKTRIKTTLVVYFIIFHNCTSASSIKTRIKTSSSLYILLFLVVRVHLPLKQGLRLILGFPILNLYSLYECIFH